MVEGRDQRGKLLRGTIRKGQIARGAPTAALGTERDSGDRLSEFASEESDVVGQHGGASDAVADEIQCEKIGRVVSEETFRRGDLAGGAGEEDRFARSEGVFQGDKAGIDGTLRVFRLLELGEVVQGGDRNMGDRKVLLPGGPEHNAALLQDGRGDTGENTAGSRTGQNNRVFEGGGESRLGGIRCPFRRVEERAFGAAEAAPHAFGGIEGGERKSPGIFAHREGPGRADAGAMAASATLGGKQRYPLGTHPGAPDRVSRGGERARAR